MAINNYENFKLGIHFILGDVVPFGVRWNIITLNVV